ncbi:MAG: hypothetical protein JWM33_900, partial [Caulobacteraceae bacterium]|nr:hypothetical protein [Caulobacteraceae bacterium]
MGPDGKIYLATEQGGGDFDHPQLWVYAPSGASNAAPTSIALTTPTASILENTDTTARVKVAGLNVTDDGLGTNTFTVSGADAKYFEADSSGLYIKAGTVLDYETKTTYSVTVNVDDTTVGATPDASVAYALNVTNVVNEGGATGGVVISEVAPWGSGNSPANVASDWFELTNVSSVDIGLSGWKMDDNSYSAGSAVAMSGVASLAPGESAIFLETTSADVVNAFRALWNIPANVQIGMYSGSGVGLGAGGDAVNVFNGAGVLQASVTFGASPGSAPFATFDNTAGLNSTSTSTHVTISTLSANGVNGAYAINPATGQEIGSPGSDGGVAAPVNHAPTALGLSSEITSLAENTSTASHVKVADLVVTDDGLGTNTFSLGGADAKYFEVDSGSLYIKAGTALDFEAQSHYAVTVNVDDATVGATPDASVDFSLNLTDVAEATVRITEVAPWSSGNSPVGADWFELTNTGSVAVDLTGWKMDDNSNSFANAVAMSGVPSLAAGQSAIFLEVGSGQTASGLAASFVNTWFGGHAPAGLLIGSYSGSGVGLSTGGDAVNVFNAAGAVQANVTFGASPTGPYTTFDNTAALNNAAITTMSSVGTHGAFAAASDSAEIGSPGLDSAINHAPTALGLSGAITSLAENTSTASHVKVADIAVTDDGQGTNTLSLSGADAKYFEVDSSGLYIKAGVTLDYETQSHYAVTVNVDDAT